MSDILEFVDAEFEENKIKRPPNDYLYAQRSLKHKVSVFYKPMENMFIEKCCTDVFSNAEIFKNNQFEVIDEDNVLLNCNNATNLEQLYSDETYNKDISYDKYLYLDGKTTFKSAGYDKHGNEEGLNLLSRDASGKTMDLIGWMSRTTCNEDGYFEKPVRLLYKFKSDQCIIKWLIRSVASEVPEDFSVCIYDSNGKMIFKKLWTGNTNSRVEIDVYRGLCRFIELRITRWGIKGGNADNRLEHKITGAKIVYFYHHATFPQGITDYKSNDLLQSFSVNEYLCSSIGKANYGVQSNTGQFTLININKLFDTLKSSGFLKNGLKVQYFVAVNKYFEPKTDAEGNVIEEINSRRATLNQGEINEKPPEFNGNNDGVATEISNNQVVLGENSTALSLESDDGNWELLATHYITDIEFDEVKNIVKFKTQDRMIKFKDTTYSGYKKVVGDKLVPIRNCDLIEDIMSRSHQKPQSTVDVSERGTEDKQEYKITVNAKDSMKKRIIDQGYLDSMSTWSALQKACDVDLIHAYIDREDILIIDKIEQL